MNNDNNVLPVDFDGVFRFTNFTDEVFTAKWGGIEYIYEPQSTTPMVISNATPEEIQHIRKKFARELAIVVFYKTPKFVGMNATQPGGVPALYTDSDLAPFIQRCLEPLPISAPRAKAVPQTLNEDQLRKDNKGKNVTKVLEDGDSLTENGANTVA